MNTELLNELSECLKATRVTAEVRKVSAQFFHRVKDEDLDTVLAVCEELLAQRKRQFRVVAFDWAFRMRKHYTRDTWPVFERWLKEYVRGWGDCDDFCTHAFGELLAQYNDLFARVIPWTEHPDFWVRRAAAVILIYPVRKQRALGLDPFLIADRLMHDEHYLVLKGYGWLLKEVSRYEEDAVAAYLARHRPHMPRIAFRYALEKMPGERRKMLMNL
ncbi:MAG TPA: DNA alkylation repair protein [Bacillota bacterium]|nr:DNA alkylation repair protein [Bacillota bacterium]